MEAEDGLSALGYRLSASPVSVAICFATLAAMPRPTARVAIVGAGISGLAAANRLIELAPAVQATVFEAAPRVGGIIETVARDGFLIERSADSFITQIPAALRLCERLEIADQLVPTEATRRRALVVRDGKLLPIPEGFVVMAPTKWRPILRSPVLSWRGKLRLACEPFIPKHKGGGDESVASFARRRLGRECFERLVQPLLSGIYTADPEKLSLAATMPQFIEQEQKHGSLWRASRRVRTDESATESGARYSKFVAPRGGMGSLISALAAKLPAGSCRVNSPVERVTRTSGGEWELQLRGGEVHHFDGVIFASPAPHVAEAVQGVDARLAEQLSDIEYAGASVVCLGFRADQISRPVDAFGFVVPAIEKRRIIAGSFASAKFPGRAPQGHVLVRVFLGGALQPRMNALSDQELVEVATDELRQLIGLKGEAESVEIARWPASMPQYHLGHLERVSQIEARVAQLPGLALAGNAYRGVGIPQCVQSGEAAAEGMVKYLAHS
ncbi:MAG: protoporphyrinogen oxidase [Pirellulales bacterium]